MKPAAVFMSTRHPLNPDEAFVEAGFAARTKTSPPYTMTVWDTKWMH
jgi:hypothetical protein